MKQAIEQLMNAGRCERESEVLRAVRTGRWPQAADDEIVRHAASCAVCAEVVLVAQYLAGEAARQANQESLPHPGMIWWRAEIMARRDAARRATRPIAIAEWVAIACGLALALAAVILEWPKLYTWTLKSGTASRLADLVAGFTSGASNTVAVMSVAACLALAAFVLYIVWAESSR